MMSTSNGESVERQRDGWEEKGAKPSSSNPVAEPGTGPSGPAGTSKPAATERDTE